MEDLALGYAGSLEKAGFKGLLYLSGLGAETTISDCLTHFPSGYEPLGEGEDVEDTLLWRSSPAGIEQLENSTDTERIPLQASLVVGTVVEQRVPCATNDVEREIAALMNRPDPGWTTAVRIETEAGPRFECQVDLLEPGFVKDFPIGSRVVAAVLTWGRTQDGVLSGPLLVCDELDQAVIVPDYGRGAAGNYARSRLNRLWATSVDLRPYPDQDMLRLRLLTLHGPQAESDVVDAGDLAAQVSATLAAKRALDPVMPSPRLVKTVFDAEAYAAEVMRALGFRDARTTARGNDAGIDVISERGVAQVKMEGLPTGRPAVQALVGAAFVEGKMPLFFSLAGYTPQAREWASVAGVAAFEFAFNGEVVACSDMAASLMRNGLTTDP